MHHKVFSAIVSFSSVLRIRGSMAVIATLRTPTWGCDSCNSGIAQVCHSESTSPCHNLICRLMMSRIVVYYTSWISLSIWFTWVSSPVTSWIHLSAPRCSHYFLEVDFLHYMRSPGYYGHGHRSHLHSYSLFSPSYSPYRRSRTRTRPPTPYCSSHSRGRLSRFISPYILVHYFSSTLSRPSRSPCSSGEG